MIPRDVNLRDLIGMLLVLAFIGAFPVLFFKAIPEGNRDLITYMLGQLSGLVVGVVGYHYASNAAQQRAANKVIDNTDPANITADNVDVTTETATVTKGKPK